MSHFYGVLRGARGEATRCGSKGSGLQTTAASWSGAVVVALYIDAQGRDCYRIEQARWHGQGVNEVIACGVIGEKRSSPHEPDCAKETDR